MNNVVAFQGHLNSSITSFSFSPTDKKFATSGSDGTVRIWDFERCNDEKTYREHGGDVTVVMWHMNKGLVASGSRDTQQSVKLWDPRIYKSLKTLYVHKSAVSDIKWHAEGNLFLTAGRDGSSKLMDIRNLARELKNFKQERSNSEAFIPNKVSWSPVSPDFFVLGSCNGSLQHWTLHRPSEPLFEVENAHDSCINGILWHPLGHIMVSASSDNTCKFWARDRPGEQLTNLTRTIDTFSEADKLIENTKNESDPKNQARLINIVDYDDVDIPHITKKENSGPKSLALPEYIDINLIPPIEGDLTTIIQNSFWSYNLPKNFRTLT